MRKPLSRLMVAVLLFAAVGGVLAFVASAPSAEAIAGPGLCTYYSDATYTTVVGARGTGCCGAVISWGTTTPYRRCGIVYCLDVICPVTE